MAYQAWSVVFGEQPSASKWNILGNNDAALRDGTGIQITNNQPIQGLNASAVAQDMIKIDTSNRVVIGDADLKGVYGINGCYLASGNAALSGTATAIANATATSYPFNEAGEELYDPLGMHSTSSNTDRITVPVAGLYRVSFNVMWPDSTVGVRIHDVFKNGGATILMSARQAQDANGRSAFSAIGVISLAANDYISLSIYQSSGGNLTPSLVHLDLELVGA